MNKQEAIKYVFVRSIGNFLLLFSLYGVAATFGPALSYELQYRIIAMRGIHFQVAPDTTRHCERPEGARQSHTEDCFVANAPRNDVNAPGFAQVLAGDKEQILIPKDTQFSISIPKIGASAKVYPNIDPTNASEFLPVLQKGIAHAKGTVFPGMAGNIYLFAHSTDNWWDVGRYNAIFYLLHYLTKGDEIVVFFEDTRHEYVVSQTLIAGPDDVSFLTKEHSGTEQLVLQTCWPPGTTWKRLYVLATPKI